MPRKAPQARSRRTVRPRSQATEPSTSTQLEPEPSPASPTAPPRPKRARRRATHVSQPTEAAVVPAEKFCALPLEVLHEALSYFDAYDILKLSRCSKGWREFLLKRSNAWVWTQALLNVLGLPPCPPWLTEPAYTHLAFDPHCHICLAPGISTIEWEFRLRCCMSCRDRLCVFAEHDKQRGTYYLKAPQRLRIPTGHFPASEVYGQAYLKSDWLEFLDDLKRRLPDRTAGIELNRNGVEVWFADLLEERRKTTAAIREHADRAKSWHCGYRCQMQRHSLMRSSQILSRLKSLGWIDKDGRMMEYSNVLLKGGWLGVTRGVSDEEWKHIRGPVLRVIKEHEASNLNGVHGKAVKRRLATLKSTLASQLDSEEETSPAILAAIALSPAVRYIIDGWSRLDPGRDDYESIPIQAIVREYRTTREQAILQELRRGHSPRSRVNIRKLARSTILCACGEILEFNTLLRHHCSTAMDEEADFEGDDYEKEVRKVHGSSDPAHLAGLKVEWSMGRMDELITACGKDPKKAMWDDMEAMDASFVCKACTIKQRKQAPTPTFMEATTHCLRSHPRHYSLGWEVRVSKVKK